MKRNRRSFVLTIVITIFCLSSITIYNQVGYYNSIMAKMENQGMGVLREAKERIEKYFTETVDIVQLTAVSLEYMAENGSSAEEIERFLVYESVRYENEIDTNFTGIYGVINGMYIHSSGLEPEADYIPQEKEWYIKAKENPREVVLVSPYLDARSNTMVLSVSKALSDGNGVIAVDIVLDEIQDHIEGIGLNATGYSFIVDKNGQVIAHSNKDEIGKNYLEDAQAVSFLNVVFNQEQAYFESVLDGKNYQICSNNILDNWYIVAVCDKELFFSDVNKTLVFNLLLYGITSVLIVAIYIYSFRRVQRSIELERNVKDDIKAANIKLIRALVRTIDAKDRYTNGHSVRVADYAYQIAQRLGKSEEELQIVYFAGLLHDVGKIRVPDEIINKPGKLTDDEYSQMKIHPVTGYHILKDIYDNKTIAKGVKYHHERYDGKGYPVGLGGENIPEIARILAVADTYDAMTSKRSYRGALGQEKVREEIKNGKGTQFDPEIADVMLQMIEEDKNYSMREIVSAQKTVLVIDNEPENMQCIEQFIQGENVCDIINASNGEEAMAILRKTPIHLVLLNIEEPELDGLDIFSKISEKYDIPTIFITGNEGRDTIQNSAKLSEEEYINNPFTPYMIKEIVHSMLND